MVVYLLNKENQVLNTYHNVINWANNFVEYMCGKYRVKRHCDLDNEYFSDKKPIEEVQDDTV